MLYRRPVARINNARFPGGEERPLIVGIGIRNGPILRVTHTALSAQGQEDWIISVELGRNKEKAGRRFCTFRLSFKE